MQHFNFNLFFKLLILSTFTLLNAGTYDEKTKAGTDVAQEKSKTAEHSSSDTEVETNPDSLKIGIDDYKFLNGIRFQDIDIPMGATINSAYIQFDADDDNAKTTKINIQAEDIDDSPTFQEEDRNISSRDRTSNSLEWDIPEWEKNGDRKSAQKTPDIKNIIQEVIDRSGWSNGNNLSVILTTGDGCDNEDCFRKAEGHHSGDDEAPVLTIDWTADDNPKATVSNISIKEKTDEDVTLTFTVKLNKDAPTNGSTFKYKLTDDTAEKGTDYEVKSGETGENENITIAEGEDSRTISITIKGEDVQEDDETFTITIEAVENLTIRDSEKDATGTIEDDDTPSCTKSGTIDLIMKNNDSDAEQKGDSVSNTSDDLEMMYDSNDEQKIGMVFQDVNIQQDCYVKEAYIQFKAKGNTDGLTNLVIYGEDEDNASTYENERKITDATKTSKSVKWKQINNWADGQKDEDTRTINISCLAEHILKREQWETNNTMGFVLYPTSDCNSSDCNRRAYSGEGSSDERPILHIEYSNNIDDSRPCATANDDEYNIPKDRNVTLEITENDSEADDDSISIKTEPEHGTYTIDGNNVVYTPDDGYEGDDSFTYTIKVDGEESNIATVSLEIKKNCTQSADIDITMKNGFGDVEQVGDNIDNDDSELELMYDGSHKQTIGMVFENVNIEQGCYIKKAYIQYTSSDEKNTDTSLIIYGEDEDNATNYENERAVSDAKKTDESQVWKNIKDWKSSQQDKDTRTPNISCLVEKILYRTNWEQNNSMGFILEPTDDCTDETCIRSSYSGDEGDESKRPILHIEYSDNEADSNPCQIAQDDSYEVRMGETITLEVTENDADDVDDDSITIKTEPQHGTYTIDGNNVIYTPNNGYKGDDNLTYTVTVSGQESNEAFVDLYINLKGGDVEFFISNPEETRNIQGNFIIGGNMIICRADNESAECESHQGTNNEYMKNIDIDDDDSTYNSSSFTLDTPDGSKIIWAGLYWGGFIHNSEDGDDWKNGDKIDSAKEYNNGPGLDLEDNAYETDKVKFKHPKTDEYIDVNATTVYFSKYGYSGFADVTNIFKENTDLQNNPDGNYTLANVSVNHKKMENHGNSGGWSMVVIYENDTSDYKTVTIFNGWREIDQDHDVDMNVTGFLIPKSTNVKAKLSFISFDGDGGDCHFKLNDEKLGLWTDEAGNQHDDRDSVFNSTIVGVPLKYPDFNLTDNDDDFYSSFEIDTYDANGILESGDTSANIKLDMGNNAAYEVPLIIFSADMYSPKFCYDYAYKQGNKYFTEENNGTQRPKIIGNIDKDKPIDVEIYLRNNEDSDLEAIDFIVDIKDINSSQAKYKKESTWITKPNSSKRISIDDDDLNVSDEYDKNISLDNMGSKEYIYFGYTLDANISDINISINSYAKYNLVIGDKTVLLPKIKLGNERIEICSESGKYQVIRGIFNIVHKDYYDNDKYYNLPTQVTSRQGEFEVISLQKDSEELNNTITTIVAIDLINVDAYHDTMASCTELNNTLTNNKKWVIFNDADNGKVDFDKNVVDSDFYKMANKNTAFRISYHTDVNNSIITLTKDDDNYIINDYNKTFKDINKSSDCGSDGDSLTTTDLINCMKYIYGQRTSMVCSRDNFSLRPEAFSMKLYDQNQTDTTSKIAINGNNINISSGYNYFLEVNATNHQNSEYSPSYKTNIDANISWNSSKTGCNDESNITTPLTFKDGKIENNISVNQVGEYILSMIDTQWTKIDQNATHHQNDGNFSTEHIDCIENSNVVANTGTNGSDNTPLNGCNISSEHTNSEKSLEYKNYNLTLHPYSFKFNITTTYGLNNSIIDDNNKSYIYMTDMNYNNHQDKNNSVHINGEITASSYNDTKLSNFVKDCYAQDLNLSINKSNIIGTIAYKYLFSSFKSDGTIDRNISGDINSTSDTIAIIDDDFQKDLNGTIKTTLNLNFERNITRLANPESIRFRSYDVNNTTPFNANLKTDEFAKNSLDINKTLIHYYGRTHSARQRYNGNSGEAKIYYEVYCYGNDCNKSLLQDGTTSRRTNDLRWYINTVHDSSKDGAVGTVNEKVSSYITATTPSSSNPSKTTLTYDETQGMPYKSTMENNASYWLIYNKDDVNAETNEFKVEFGGGTTGWSGAHETNSTTKDHPATITNRRSMW